MPKEEEEEKHDVGRFRDGLSVGHGSCDEAIFIFCGGRERTIFALKDIAEPQMDERD